MKKISILSLHLGFGGAEKSIITLANLLCNKYDVEIATTYKLYDNPAFKLDNRVKIIYLTDVKPNKQELKNAIKNMKIFNIIKELFYSIKVLLKKKNTMIKYIKSNPSDVIISTRVTFNKYLKKSKDKKCIKIAWEHNDFHGKEKLAKKVIKSSYKFDYLVLVSKRLQKYYNENMIGNKCKCIYIPNIVDDNMYALSNLEDKNFISIGRLSSEKGYMDLVMIFKEFVKKHNDWKLNIIGDGDERVNIEKYIYENNLNENIILHGFQDKDYINNMLQNSSIYLMTSYTESFGIVLIEAMSFGLPCIAFDSAEGANEIIVNNENGYLIKNRNFNDYIEKMEELINNSELRNSLGKNAANSIDKYKGENVIKYWFEIIKE